MCTLHRTQNILRPSMQLMSMSGKSLIPDDITKKINKIEEKIAKIYKNVKENLGGSLKMLPDSEYNHLNKLQTKKFKLQDQKLKLHDEIIKRHDESILLKASTPSMPG